jgi:hypothetical protein
MDGSARTCDHAKAALLARGFVDHHSAVFLLCDCAETTNGNTRGVVAMKARGENKILMQFSVNFPWADSGDRTPSRTRREPVFLFAGDFARVACDAPINVNQQKLSFHPLSF